MAPRASANCIQDLPRITHMSIPKFRQGASSNCAQKRPRIATESVFELRPGASSKRTRASPNGAEERSRMAPKSVPE